MKNYCMHTLAANCAARGVTHAVTAPGSRSAPLCLAFVAQPHIQVHDAVHENSAAFLALGLALYTGTTVVLICTSGTAGLHFAPAIAEALYQEVPLLVLTADRPPEWIGQQEGQTLPQNSMYGPLVKRSYSFPDLGTEPSASQDPYWHARRLTGEALSLSQLAPAGPVHINIPLRPPLYTSTVAPKTEEVAPPQQCLPYDRVLRPEGWHSIQALLEQHPKVLLLGGQAPFDKNMLRRMEDFCEEQHIPILAEPLSNLHGLPQVLRHSDFFLRTAAQALQPDLVISFGGHILSKYTKTFLRKYPPKAHLRLWAQESPPPDTLQCLTHQVPLMPSHFFLEAKAQLKPLHIPTRKAFKKAWEEAEKKAQHTLQKKLKEAPFGQLKAVALILAALPHHLHLHLGNSMPVRYATYLGLRPEQEAVEVFANRGTCGIDGSLSTAIGVCRGSAYVLNAVLLGDISFLHDQGALLNSPLPANLRILLLNDHGGGIFRLLPDAQTRHPEESHFVMPQHHNIKALAQAYALKHRQVNSAPALQKALPSFFQPGPEAELLEIETDPSVDMRTFAHIFSAL